MWCQFLQWTMKDNTFLFSGKYNGTLDYFEFRTELRNLTLGNIFLQPAAAFIAINPDWPHGGVYGQFKKRVNDGQNLTFKL